jgi:hypothetical protein
MVVSAPSTVGTEPATAALPSTNSDCPQNASSEHVVVPPIERVGVIVVHGIGEQKAGDHLEAVVRVLAEALGARCHRRVSVQPLQKDRQPARARIDVAWRDKELQDRISQLEFHEVQYADINEPNTVSKGVRFWLWGLSAWLTPRRYVISNDRTFQQTMATPEFPGLHASKELSIGARAQLFLVGWVFLLIAVPMLVAEWIAKIVFRTTLPEWLRTIVAYLSSVRLYTQTRRSGVGMIEICNEPPRIAIRRRMTAVVADVALARYDRWYVLAHSQGSVVAFNGLMVSGRVWPNYLDDGRLNRLCRQGLAGRPNSSDMPTLAELTADTGFLPSVPVARTERDVVIHRSELFSRFRGFLSYGSPLDKFAAIWPPLVPINREAAVFPRDAEWINVWDPTDPVGASLDAFDAMEVLGKGVLPGIAGCQPLVPVNIPCRASPLLLLSHICYLCGPFGGKRALTDWLGDWLLDDGTNAGDLIHRLRASNQLVGPAATADPRNQLQISRKAIFYRKLHSTAIALTVWIFLLLALWVGIGARFWATAAHYLPTQLTNRVASLPWICDIGAAAFLSFAIVIIAGLIGHRYIPVDPRDRRAGGGR